MTVLACMRLMPSFEAGLVGAMQKKRYAAEPADTTVVRCISLGVVSG